MTLSDLTRLASHVPYVAARVVGGVAGWLLRPPDEPACRWANHTNEDD